MKYIPVIGLEIHAELKTKTKIFCGCSNDFGNEKNSNCCTVCTGLPGALPVINGRAIELAITAGLAFGCDIPSQTRWDRKNYFYPDSPKAYQISQLYAPLCIGGGIEINGRFIRLNRIHLEEDAGKLIHDKQFTLIDFNRAGVPLIEIVTEPDLCTSDEAVAFVEQVRQALIYADVCDGRMEQGSLRVDANISIMPEGSEKLGVRTEIKNLNSFKFIKKAIDFEIQRQQELLDSNRKIIQETRRYDELTSSTFSMRSKEDAHDYRYFPDPDILPLNITKQDVKQIKENMPELPNGRFIRYTNDFGLSNADANIILAHRFVADFYDEVVKLDVDPKNAANLIKGEILHCINQTNGPSDAIPMTAIDFVKILILASASKISQEGLKLAIYHMFHDGKNADEVIKEYNIILEEDIDLIKNVIKQILADNQNVILQYKNGNEKVISYLLGQCNKSLKGKVHPQSILRELKNALDAII